MPKGVGQADRPLRDPLVHAHGKLKSEELQRARFEEHRVEMAVFSHGPGVAGRGAVEGQGLAKNRFAGGKGLKGEVPRAIELNEVIPAAIQGEERRCILGNPRLSKGRLAGLLEQGQGRPKEVEEDGADGRQYAKSPQGDEAGGQPVQPVPPSISPFSWGRGLRHGLGHPKPFPRRDLRGEGDVAVAKDQPLSFSGQHEAQEFPL